MQKLVLTFLCACVLLLPGFTSNDPDINKACEVAEAYFAAANDGNTETMLKLSAAGHRDYFNEKNVAADPWFKLGMLFVKKAQFTIISAEKYGEGLIELKMAGRVPNIEDFMEETKEQVKKELGPYAGEDELIAKALPLFEKHLESVGDDNMEEGDFTINLIKENGQWRVDESLG